MQDSIVKFVRKKDYTYLKEIGQGGTGRTVLLKDTTIDELFVCKKYQPIYEEDFDLYYENFVNEIKIMYKLSHNNIVKIYNYHLYSKEKTGYIIMEYIDGENIDVYLSNNLSNIENIFIQVLNGFLYLETKKILHRDIRPANILVDRNGVVKIIDFGFGKKAIFDDSYNKSITLNWRYSAPSEFSENIYNHSTEIYFIGKMFDEFLNENNVKNFKYINLVSKMIQIKPQNRYNRFEEILDDLENNKNYNKYLFSDLETTIYKTFIFNFLNSISKIEKDYIEMKDVDTIIDILSAIYESNMLNEFVNKSNSVISAFINNNFKYYTSEKIKIESLKDFIDLLSQSNAIKRRIILKNIASALDGLERFYPAPPPPPSFDAGTFGTDDDLPF